MKSMFDNILINVQHLSNVLAQFWEIAMHLRMFKHVRNTSMRKPLLSINMHLSVISTLSPKLAASYNQIVNVMK